MKNEIKCSRIFADKQQISHCRIRLTEVNDSIDKLSQALNLAGNNVRLKILFLLYEEENLCVCDLSDILEMKIQAVSQHLRKLKDAKIILNKKEGQTIFYSLSPEHRNLFEGFFMMIGTNEILKKVS